MGGPLLGLLNKTAKMGGATSCFFDSAVALAPAFHTLDGPFAVCENHGVHLISRRPLKQFWERHPDAETALRHWIRAVETSTWRTFADVRQLFGSADQVGKFVVFNIAGNKYRLIAVIHYDRQKVYVRDILTHQEYDLGKWKRG